MLKYKHGKTTQRSLLSSVQYCGNWNGSRWTDCVAPTRFDYTDASGNTMPFNYNQEIWYRFSGGNAPNSDNMSIRLMADVNGDGMQDMAHVINSKRNKDKVCTALSTGTSFRSPTCAWAEMRTQDNDEPYAITDTNGDGKSDFVYFSTNHSWLSYHAASPTEGTTNGFHGMKRWGKSKTLSTIRGRGVVRVGIIKRKRNTIPTTTPATRWTSITMVGWMSWHLVKAMSKLLLPTEMEI